MKNMRAVVKATNNRPKRRPMELRRRRLLQVGQPLGAGPCVPAQGPPFSRTNQQMQLSHSHRQLLSRCSLRWYSVPASNSSDATAASGTLVPSRLKRPFASSFGGIDIRTPHLLASPILKWFLIPVSLFRKCRSPHAISIEWFS
jgi:hypothetical protein